MSETGNSRSASKSFLGRRRSSPVDACKDQRRSSVSRVFKKKTSTSQVEEQVTKTSYPIDIDAQMAAIKEQLNGLRLQRTDMQRRVEDINTTLNDIRGEYATRVSLSGSTSDLSSIGSLASISDESSLSSGFSHCCLLDDCESSGIEFDMEDDDCETDCASSSTSSSTTGIVELGSDETEEEDPELLSVSQVAYL